jgi:hypothetical protein
MLSSAVDKQQHKVTYIYNPVPISCLSQTHLCGFTYIYIYIYIHHPMFITPAKLPSRKFITTRTLVGLASGISHYVRKIFLYLSSTPLQLLHLRSGTSKTQRCKMKLRYITVHSPPPTPLMPRFCNVILVTFLSLRFVY